MKKSKMKIYNKIQISVTRGIGLGVMEFHTPVEECIERDSKREKSVGKAVILNMYNTYLKPKNE